MNKIIQSLIIQIVAFLLLFGCGGGDETEITTVTDDVENSPETTGNWYRPPIFSTWQWQLSGEVNTSYNVNIYDIDLFDSSTVLIQQLQADKIKVICYFSAGTYEQWRSDENKFNLSDIGLPLDNWPGENWLDIRSPNVLLIVKERLDLAAKKGCDGVEPDNVDGYTNNTGFNLTFNDQLRFNRTIANEAHSRNLAVGLKNNIEQAIELVDYYDFAVNEQCFDNSECNLLIPFIDNGKPVLNVEYATKYIQDGKEKEALCTKSLGMQFSTLILPSDLDGEFRLSCL
ncbi:endo alpha-1,4 polygalactosaminidase [Photobacterium nomapromontoriensis]|uniref:endo alpha-1,4 polygalactosaminidase n=1 Tax=Photobacterium nomapromontoriensis TaxID=2910237 RepID=UPI003D0B1076